MVKCPKCGYEPKKFAVQCPKCRTSLLPRETDESLAKRFLERIEQKEKQKVLDIKGSPLARMVGVNEFESILVNFSEWRCRCGCKSFYVADVAGLDVKGYRCTKCGRVCTAQELRDLCGKTLSTPRKEGAEGGDK